MESIMEIIVDVVSLLSMFRKKKKINVKNKLYIYKE